MQNKNMFIGTTIKVILLLTMCMSTMAFVQAYQGALYKWSTDAGLTHDGSRVSQWDNYGSNSSVYLQQGDYNCRPYMNQKLLKGISVVSFNGNDENTLCESLWSANAWNNFVIPTDINFSAINIFLVQSTNFRSSAYSNNSIASESLNQGGGGGADGSYRIEFNNENITWMAGNNNSNMSTTWAGKQIFNGANSMNNPGGLEYRDKPMVRGFTFNSATAGGDGQRIRYNGKDLSVAASADNSSNMRRALSINPVTSNQNNAFSMGHQWGPRNGTLAEMLIFTGLVTANQRASIESYLSLKRGLPFESNSQSYRNGAQTIVWDNTTNASYNNEVIGVGRDTTTTLNTTTAGYNVIPTVPNSIALPLLPSNNVGTIFTTSTTGPTGGTVNVTQVPAGYQVYYNTPSGISFSEDRMYELSYWARSLAGTRTLIGYIASPQGSWYDGIGGMQIISRRHITLNTTRQKVTIKFYAKQLQGSTYRIYLDQTASNNDSIQYYDAVIKEYSPMGANNLLIQTSTTLTDGQYLIAGHNNTGTVAWTAGGPGTMDILSRRWLFQRTGPTNAYTVTLSLPDNVLVGVSNNAYVVIDNDTDPNNGITSYQQLTYASNRYSAAGLTIPAGNSYISFVRGNPSTNIGGNVWVDANKNGLQDGGEIGLGSVTVKLYSCAGYASAGTQVQTNYTTGGAVTVTTLADGSYNFAAFPGTYYLEFLPSSSYKFTTQHAGGYGTNIATNSDAHPHSGKTRCENFSFATTDTSIDAGLITQSYSSCDALTLSNVITVGANKYQKPNVSFTATLVGYGQNASVAGSNVAGGGSITQAPGAYNRSPSLSSSAIGDWTINATIDGYNYKLDYYNNPAAYTNTCMYRTISAGNFCAIQAPLAPYIGSSVNMNSSPTTISPIAYCDGSQNLSYPCTAPIDAPQSALVQTPNTCSQTIRIRSEAEICNTLVGDMSAADCNGLVALYNSAGGASRTNKTNWMFNGDTTWTTACDWYGVSCAGGRVSAISLSSNNMGGTLPTLPAGAWTALTDINFATNNIGGSLPSAWSTLTAMRNFNIAGNANLNTTLPTSWSTWTQMIGFWIYGTTPGGTIPTQWSTWTQLQTFDANSPTNGVGFNGTLPASWSSMTNIRGFYVFNHKLDGTIPTSWSAMTQLRSIMLHNNNLDGPIPSTVESWTLLDTAGWNSVISSNCMGTGHVGGTLLTHLNSRFAGTDPATWNNAAAYGWRYQKVCATDLRITSATITAGDLTNNNTATYSITVQNQGSRWAYAPRVAVSMGGGLSANTTTLIYGTLAPGASQTLTFTASKGSVSAGTNNVTNTFTVSDTTISDPSNNVATHVVSVRGSTHTICNNSALNITVGDCEALGDLYDSTNGASWINKTNWKTNPNTESRWGVRTSQNNNGLLAHYNFEGSAATDVAGNGNNGTLVNSPTFGAGTFGNAINFAGSSEVTIPSRTMGNGDWTVSARVKTTDTSSNYGNVLSNNNGGPVTSAMGISNGKIRYSNYNGTWNGWEGTRNVADGQWHLLTWVNKSNNTMDMYVDGVLDLGGFGSATYSGGPVNSIGRNWYSSFNGAIDEVRIYNRGLSAGEITSLMNTNNITTPGRVTQLGLGRYNTSSDFLWCSGNCGNNLSGPIPSSFGNLTELIYVFINSNLITSLPSSFWNLNKVQYLTAYGNRIAGAIPSTVSNMTAMYYFHLNGNGGYLTGPIPSQLFSLPNIGYVILSSNTFNSAVPTLTYNPSLFYIDLNGAGIVGNPFAELVKMTNLTELHISGNPSIGGTLPSTINNLTKLTQLNVSNDGLSSTFPNITIPTLTTMYGYANSFNGSLPSLPSTMRYVHLTDNQFTGPLPSSWSSIPNFNYIYVWSNQLDGQIPASWASMTNLISLGIGNNNIEGVFPVSTIQSMTSLTNNTENMVGSNCLYMGSLTTGQISYMDTKFGVYNSNGTWAWRNQKACGTDLEVVSATPSGTLQNGSQITYTVTIRNNGPRIAYDPRLTITLTNGLQFSDSSNSTKTISLGQMTAGQTIIQTIIVNKLGVGSTTINYTNTFAVADTSTTDPTPANNSKSHAGTANGSAYPICLNPATNVIQSDCEALGDLYTSTAGANWTRKDNWLSSTDVDSWFGVTVAGGRVTQLCPVRDSSGNERCEYYGLTNNIVGSLPSSIGNLTELTRLSISKNSITGPLPTTIGNLTKLQYFYFNENQINGTLPTTIGALDELYYLFGWNNLLTGPLPSQISDMAKIQYIHLNGNQINGTIPDLTAINDTIYYLVISANQFSGPAIGTSWWNNMTNLRYLHLSGNPLGGSLGSWICNFTLMQDLYLENIGMNGSIPSCIGSLGSAQTTKYAFAIHNNNLTGSIPTELGNTNFQYYYLGINPNMRGTIPSSFGNSTAIKELYFLNMGLVGTIPSSFSNLTNLYRFQMESNYLDRDTSDNALIPSSLASWWAARQTYDPNAWGNSRRFSRNAQGDITAPLLGANAKRLPASPGFNYNGQSISTAIIAGPNGSNVEAVLLGGSPYHVAYDNGYHGITFQNGKTYTYSFWARTTAGTRTIAPGFTDDVNTNFIGQQTYTIDTTRKQITIRGTYSTVGASPRVFVTNDGGGASFYYYDPVVTESTNLPTAIDTNIVNYPLMVTDGSDWDTAGRVVSVGGGGTCSNLTVTPNKNNDNGLFSYYNFDDSTARDKSSNNRNGTIVGGTTFVTNSPFAGYTAKFDGSSVGRVATVESSSAGNNITWSAWINREQSINTFNMFMGQYLPYAAFRSDGYIMWSLNINGSQQSISSASNAYTDNTWYLVTMTYDGSTIRLYINGVLSNSQSQPGTLQYNAGGPLTIGDGQNTAWYPFKGKIDDVRVYNRTLSATEIAQMYGTTINFSAQGSYAGCYLTTTDRGSNTSNAVRLGDFTATFSPYPICNNPARTVPQSECTALMDLYTSAGGASWTNKTNWGTSPDINSWFGITTIDIAGQQRVSAICINRTAGGAENCGYDGIGNNMIGSLPTSIGSFPYLTTLTFSNNIGLTGPIPTGIGSLTNLQTFYSTTTKLNGTLPDSMANLNNLTNLYLWGNDLSGNLPSAWGAGMNSINYIHLDSNLLSGPIPASWANFANRMTAFVISGQRGATKLNGTLPSWLGNFTKISWVLYLHGNQFTGPIPSTLGNLTGAIQMYLSNNLLSGPIPPELGNMKALTHLGLQGNQLTGPLPTNLSNLTNLTDFYVNANSLDRDLGNNAIIPAGLTTWYNARATKDISAQTDTTAPVISGNPLAGTYSFSSMSYTINMTESSTIAGGGQTVTVAGGGTCSQLTVAGTLTNGAGANTITLQFAPGGNATTAYSNCTLSTTDRASLVSNTINLGNFSVKLNPFPICNNVNLTVSQEQCGALMDFYTNLGGASWTTKTNWSAGTTVGNWFGVTTANSLIAQYDFTSNATDSSPSAANGTVNGSITFTAGKNGNSATFPASHAGITANIPSITKDQTICMWLKPDDLSQRRNPYNKSYGGEGTITQEPGGSLSYYYGINGPDGGTYMGFGSAGGVVVVGQWTHACLVRDLSSPSKTLKWYINGVLNTQTTALYATAATTSTATTIGYGYTGYPYMGQMDDVRLYDRALSLDEVNQLYLSNQMGSQTVTQLRFPSANNMIGTFPNVFDRLPSLTAIEINYNGGITGPIPATISNLPKLIELGLNSLGINGSLPSTLPTTLTSLSINTMASLAAGPLPSAWSLLTNLNYLSVQGINANGALPGSWSSLVNLTYMHLANNNFNGQIPTSWLTALVGIGQMYWEGSNIDGPLPPEMATWNTNTAYSANYLSNNCFGTGHLTPAQVNAFDTKYTRAKWAPQRACTTDIQVSVSAAGNLTTSNAMLYTVTVTNAGSRWAYSPRVAVNLQQGLMANNSATPTIMYSTLAPGASQTQTISVIKSASSPTAQTDATNTFTVSDPTITDTINNSTTHVIAVKKSNISAICDHYALNIPIAECEALTSLYSSTAGASWTNKTNWLTSPNTDNWYGITTSQDTDLVAHYTFDASNATDDAGNGNNGTLINSPTFGAGVYGNAINFDRTAKRVVINNTNIPQGKSDFTYAWWTKWNATPSNATASYFENGTWGNSLIIRQETAGLIYIYSMGNYIGAFNFTPVVGQWYHLSIVRSGNTIYLYVNGVQSGSITFNVNLVPSADLWIGASQHSPTQALNAAMDDVRIYNRGLSAGEITSLYQTANPTTDRTTRLMFGNGSTYGAGGGNNLVGTIPTTLNALTELTHFWVDSNAGLVGQIPSNFWNMTKIQDVRTMYTQFTGGLPTFGSSYPSLNTIIMSQSRLSGPLPTTWGQNTALSTIWLGNNPFNNTEKITGNLPSSRGSLVNLQGLAVYYAGLTGSIPSTYGAMTQMNNFQLINNQLSGPLPSTLSQWTNLYAIYINGNQLTGNLSTIMSGWNANLIGHFGVSANNFDRDSSNNAIISPNIQARLAGMVAYQLDTQGDISAPVLAFTSMATNVDDVVQISFTLSEGSSTTGAGYPDGLTVGFTGSTACASLSTSPVKLINRGSMVVDVVGAAGTYAGCTMFVRDRANLISNLMSPGTIVIPNYAICGVVTDMARGDCKALVDIYTDTNGSGWNYKANWMGLGDSTPTTACDWQDVTCTGNRVGGLVLGHASWHDYNSGKNLSGILPATLGNLTGLTQLIIANNPNLVGNIPTTISNLKSLTVLTMYYNSPTFGGVVPTQISTMTGLQGITLIGGGFSGTLDVFAPLHRLTSLHIGDNKFTGPIPSSFGSMTGLVILYLMNNQLTGPIPSSLGNLTNMVYLRLENNNLKGLIPASLANMTVTHLTYPPNLDNNCLSASSSYMTVGLSNWLSTRGVIYTSQKNCGGTIGSRLWIDSDNNGRYDNSETGTGGVTVTLRSCSAQAPINTGGKLLNHQLATYYTFDTNNTVDDSFNSNDGVNNGATFIAGKMGSAANGTAGTAYITHSTKGLNSTQGTISAWINPTQTQWGLRQTHDETSQNRSDWISLFSYWGGTFYFRMGDGTNCCNNDLTFTTATYMPLSVWSHITATWSGDNDGLADDTMTIYVNGTQIVQRTNARFQGVMDLAARVGMGHSIGMYSSIDDFRAYGRALTASEISQLYNIDSATPAINFPISNSGAAVASTTSSANGTYSFTNQPAGRYYLEYSNMPNGYKFTSQNWGGYHNSANSDVNPWSAKTSCFELYNGLNETNINAGLKYLPYSSCENTSAAYTPTLLGQPVTLSIGGYGTNGQIQAMANIAPQATITDTGGSYFGTAGLVDGITSSAGTLDYAYHASTSGTWIDFSFGSVLTPSLMRIYNRVGCCQFRLSNAIITLYDGAGSILYSYTLGDMSNQTLIDINFESMGQLYPTTRKIRLQAVGPDSFMNMREVEIYSKTQYAALNGSILSQSITNQGTNWGLKTWSYSWTPSVSSSYIINGSVDGYNYKLDYYNNPALSTLSCAYRNISVGNWCAVQATVSPYAGTALTNVNQIASIPAPISYCTAAQISSLPCSTAGDQPSAMVIQVPNTCTSSLVVTSDVNVMCDAVTDMQPAECKALISLYDSTAGASWTTKTNWRFLGDTTPRTACDWTGVTCAGGRATQINLSSNNLNGTLPALTGLNQVIALALNSNSIKGNLPLAWTTTLPAIQSINLGYNQLTGSLPTQYATMTGLIYFGAEVNGLNGNLPSSWSSLTNLTQLTLWSNPFTGSLPSSWSSLTKMTDLSLATNSTYYLNGTLPASWSSMNKLQSLTILNTQITGQIPSSWFTGMTAMKNFQLWDNQLDGPIPATGFQLWTGIAGYAATQNSTIGSNCMGSTNVTGGNQSYMNANFNGMQTWRGSTAYWANQDICQTDLQLSLITKAGSLEYGNSLTYTLRYVNAGSRWSYNTILGLTTDSRVAIIFGSTVGVTKTGINIGILAPGASGTVIFSMDKSGFGSGIYNISNSWTLTDATISDTNAGNHAYSDTSIVVDVSNYPICNNASLSTSIHQCKGLMSWYDNLGGPSRTIKTNWGTSPTVGSWYGVTTINSLVAYYPFDTNGNDSGPNGLNTTTAPSTLVASQYSNGLQNGDLTVNDNNALDITNQLTISFWMKPTGEGTYYAVNPLHKWGSDGTNSANFVLYYFGNYNSNNSNRNIGFYANAGGSWKPISSVYSKVPLNQRTHVLVSYDKDLGGQLYINGVANGSRQGGGVLTTNTGPLKIGEWSDGVLDEVRIYDRALTPNEITQLYQSNTIGDHTVTQLSYPTANNMVGTITPALDNLASLQTLRLYNQGGITGQLSGSKITSLTSLRALELSGTSMAGPVPTAISNLTQLKLLTLIGNKPTTGFTTLPSTLRDMTGLTGLYLSNNYFAGNLPALTGFTALQNLALDRNNFNSMLPATWAGFPLKVIDVRNNLLTGQIPAGYVSLAPTLNTIRFDSNELDGQIPLWLTGLVNLQ